MLSPKYKINQHIYAVSKRKTNTINHVHCDICNSTGQVSIKRHKFVCPNCYGECYSAEEYVITAEGNIVTILTKECENDSVINYIIHNELDKERDETFNETECFMNIDEANSYCAYKNNTL